MDRQDILYSADGSPTGVIIRRSDSFAQTIPLNELNRDFRRWREKEGKKPGPEQLPWQAQVAPGVARARMIAAGLGWPYGD